MDEIVQFLTKHWILTSLFVVVLLAFIANEFWVARKGHGVSPEEAVLKINHEEALVLDVRKANAYATGHILDAVNIPAAEIEKKLASLNKWKDKPIIVVCNVGQDSAKVCHLLNEKGFKALNLEGGVS